MLVLAAIPLAAQPVAAQDSGPSFDCRRASHPVLKAVCNDPALASLDRILDGHYRGAQQALGEGAACLKHDQRQWMGKRNACGSDVACLNARYLERIAALNGLQPGARQISSLKLPSVPSLVTALPPPADGRTGPAGMQVEHRGTFVHEQADVWNMGLAIKTADGKAHVLLVEMDFDGGAPHRALASAMESDRGATFIAKGNAGENGAFAATRCRFVYRLPPE